MRCCSLAWSRGLIAWLGRQLRGRFSGQELWFVSVVIARRCPRGPMWCYRSRLTLKAQALTLTLTANPSFPTPPRCHEPRPGLAGIFCKSWPSCWIFRTLRIPTWIRYRLNLTWPLGPRCGYRLGRRLKRQVRQPPIVTTLPALPTCRFMRPTQWYGEPVPFSVPQMQRT